MGIKVYLNYLLWYVGMRDILPRDIINSVKIVESDEKLESLVGIPNILISKDLNDNEKYARSGVIDKIKSISKKIDGKYQLMILFAYRSLETQKKNFDIKFNLIKNENPNLSDEEVYNMTRKIVASPDGFGGHQTGGALDVTLCNADGIPFDMGTKYSELNPLVKTNNKLITTQQAKNRKMLCNIMKSEGFINYPGEWWHFCYGDRMWAAYSKKRNAIYGYIEKAKIK
jgi:D-alanyl-D-alanine dipeptidase